MNASNFSSVLDKPSSAIQKPKPWPVGGYIGVIQGLPRIDKSTKKGTEFSEYTVKPTMAMEDVDQEALAEYGGMGQKTIRVTFYHTEDAIWRLKEFLDNCDIAAEDDDGNELSLRQRMMMVPNATIGIYVTHQASDDGADLYSNVRKTFKPE